MVSEMTIEEMTTVSYILLAVAVILGIVAVVLFVTMKIPKAYRAVKGQKKSKRRHRGKRKHHAAPKTADRKKHNSVTMKLEKQLQHKHMEEETEVLSEQEVKFTIVQDITFIHVDEEL